MDDIVAFLKMHDPFGGLEDEALERLAERAQPESFAAGTVIFEQTTKVRMVRRGAVEFSGRVSVPGRTSLVCDREGLRGRRVAGRNASSESSETVTSIAVAKWARVASSELAAGRERPKGLTTTRLTSAARSASDRAAIGSTSLDDHETRTGGEDPNSPNP